MIPDIGVVHTVSFALCRSITPELTKDYFSR
jgi:hypothetical protein